MDGPAFPLSGVSGMRRAPPFRSSLSRVENNITSLLVILGFRCTEVSWGDFIGRWVPEVRRDGTLVGVSRNGTHIAGSRRDS